MLFSSLMYWGFLVVMAALLFTLTFLLLGRRGPKKARNIAIGVFVALVALVVVSFMVRQVYIIGEGESITHLRALGQPSYTMTNGTTVPVKLGAGQCLIVNDSQEDYVVEEVIYGIGVFPGRYPVPAGESYVAERLQIDYFFGDEQPEEITSGGSNTVIHLWLHKAD